MMWPDEHYGECPMFGDDGGACECDDIAETVAADRHYEAMVDRLLAAEYSA